MLPSPSHGYEQTTPYGTFMNHYQDLSGVTPDNLRIFLERGQLRDAQSPLIGRSSRGRLLENVQSDWANDLLGQAEERRVLEHELEVVSDFLGKSLAEQRRAGWNPEMLQNRQAAIFRDLKERQHRGEFTVVSRKPRRAIVKPSTQKRRAV